jgi:DNA-binding transcriptional MerR regulator
MLRIGEFSNLTGISIHMLRNYDKIGLLIPEHTDRINGYRYYNERQIVVANQIQVLKNLGFGLKEIATILIQDESNKNIIKFVHKKKKEKNEELENIKAQIQLMEQAIRDLKKQDMCALSVVIKRISARRVASYRGIIHKFSDEGLLWAELTKNCQQLGVQFADVEYSFAITHRYDSQNLVIDVEVQRVVEKLYQDTDKIHFFEIEECVAATIAFQGVYSQIGDVMQYMAEWVKENQYQICGEAFTTYYISPGNETNPEKFITEVCFPIKKYKTLLTLV